MMKTTIGLLLFTLLLSCNTRKLFEGPDGYTDGFESYTRTEDLFPENDVRWSYSQTTFDGNAISVDTSIVHSGAKSMKAVAGKSTPEDGASKASFVKQKMAFWEGETVSLEAWYYLVGTDSANWLFIMDIEEQAPIGAGPGIRLAVVNDRLLVEHKYFKPNILQTPGQEVNFPRDQWVKVRLEILLSKKEKGTIKVFQDDVLIIEQKDWQTLPKEILYGQQGTKGMYSSVEFGITAGSNDNPMVLYVDDVDVHLVE